MALHVHSVQYTMPTVQTILDYQRMCPEVFEILARSQPTNMDMYHKDLLPSADGLKRMSELAKCIVALPTTSAMRQPYATQTLEESIIKELEEATASGSGAAKEVMQVKLGTLFCLYKRMFSVMSGSGRGLIVIRIQKGPRVEDNVYDVLYDEVFTGGLTLRCS